MKRAALETRFASFFEVGADDACWPWQGPCDKDGYGRIGEGGRLGRTILAHRLAYRLAFGSLPIGVCVCHKCDVRYCVNPKHLFLGTQKDNCDDMRRKGRRYVPVGKHPNFTNALMTERAMRKVLELSDQGLSAEQIVHLVFHEAVRGVIKMRGWKAVRQPQPQ